jgi:hypothetical protein
MFINKAAAKRLFPLVRIVAVWRMGKHSVCIRYSCKGLTCNTIVSAKLFLQDAKATREAAAKQVNSFPIPGEGFVTWSEGGKDRYKTNKQKCTCADWEGQQLRGNGFGRPVCKHQIAIANKLGFGSFKEWAIAS